MNKIKSKLRHLYYSLPTSVSQLYYDKTNLFKYIIAFIVTILVLAGLYKTALAFGLVYVFRDFRKTKQAKFHYASAGVGFFSLAFLYGFLPLVVGFLVALYAYGKRSRRYVFIFEMVAGLPYAAQVIAALI